jgi:DNA repair protein RadA/Sms
MKKAKTMYICQNCGAQYSTWSGQCSSCGEWNTLVESVVTPSNKETKNYSQGLEKLMVKQLSQVQSKEISRVSSGIGEFDRVLGGGFVPGQVILLSGDPGIGKSTILTQIAKTMTGQKILYVSGEESFSQIKIRSNRMDYTGENMYVISETNVDIITELVRSKANGGEGFDLLVVDSIQTIYTSDLMGLAGSVGQIREASGKVIQLAKSLSIPTILVGHVTKEGNIAGPKVLEHMVDTVLYLEGDFQHLFRILKAHKNRFGSVSEIGVFEMTQSGITEVTNPSEIFLSERLENASGSCISVIMEGSRPILFEIQALTTPTAFGYPRRTTTGFNVNRLNVLLAILEKRCGLKQLSSHDVYVSIAGGYKVTEYSTDLAVCLAIASSLKNIPLAKNVACFGECGLSGEVKKVTYQEARKKEAKKLGFSDIISSDSAKTVDQAIKKLL